MNFLPMLPPEQNRLLFPNCGQEPRVKAPSYRVTPILDELRSMGLEPTDTSYKATSTTLPDLGRWGNGPKDAATEVLNRRWGAVINGLLELVDMPVEPPSLDKIQIQPGWTRYGHDGTIRLVSCPEERVFLFDTETFVRGGNDPILGTAASSEAWYLWVHPAYALGSPGDWYRELIPLGLGRCFIAHNAMFDMARVLEAYELSNENRPVVMCTMAMHTTISGTGGDQVKRATKAIGRGAGYKWQDRVCGDSLQEVLRLHTGRSLSKDIRDLFVTGSLEDLYANRAQLIQYALNDTYELWWLWLALYPKFREQCPSVVTTAGMFELSRSQLPVVQDFHNRVQANSVMYQALTQELTDMVTALAAQAKDLDPALAALDPWLSQLDWTPAKSGKSKGLPAWYRKLKQGHVSMGSNLVPLLLKMRWDGEPLKYDSKKKWGYGDPFTPLPHPKGPGNNVGTPLGKDFVQFLENGTLTCSGDPQIAKKLSNLSYWQSYESRFQEQRPLPLTQDRDAIVPCTKLIGTLTGRQVEKTWLTAAQSKDKKLGSDLFHCIQPPKDWDLVLWDEDTEEVRIAAVWGDFYRGSGLGCTPMSQYAFLGDKDLGTDAHSITARIAQISRSEGKVANFRDIFGGGRKTQEQAIQSAHPDWPQEQVSATVTRILDAKRGTKTNGQYQGGTDSEYHNQAASIADTPNFRLPATGRMLPDVINVQYETTGMFYTSRYNFPVQGTGADILHATAALVPVLALDAGIPEFGYVMARHDEIGYIVPKEQSAQFAEIGNAAHCWAWALFLEGLGFDWFPTPLARLAAINVDSVYRKEVSMNTDCGYGLGWNLDPGTEIK